MRSTWEGVWVHNPNTIPGTCSATGMPCSTADGIVVDTRGTTTPPNLTMQNVRIDGISGCSGGSPPISSSRTRQAARSSKIDHLTGTSNCQGFQIDPDLSSANPPSYIIKNTNLNAIAKPLLAQRQPLHVVADRRGASGCHSGNVTLSNAYARSPTAP